MDGYLVQYRTRFYGPQLGSSTKRKPHNTQGIKRQEQEYIALGALDIGMQVRVPDTGWAWLEAQHSVTGIKSWW